MMIRGVLIEYGANLLGPIPNILVFQFNPEEIARTINIPAVAKTSATGAKQETTGQSSGPASESFSLTAHFSAADDLGEGGALSAVPRAFGVGPQLAALEKMIYPVTTPGGLIGAAIDAIGSALSGEDDGQATKPTPRTQVPKLLFIWGPSRLVPVRVRTMRIVEKQFDFLLNPVRAEVTMDLEIPVLGDNPADSLAGGALKYTNLIKDTQATLNLVKAAELALDIVPF